MWSEGIICLAVGAGCMALGLIIWKKQNISLVHEYHRNRVRPEDVPAYTRLVGQGLMLAGIGSALTGMVNAVSGTRLGWGLFALCFAAGIALFLRAQRLYQWHREA